MKIFHLFFGFRMGGAESMVIDLAGRQVARGHDVSLAVLNDEADPALVARLDPRVTVCLLGRRPGSRDPRPLLRLNRLIWRSRPDIMHFHNIGLPAAVMPPLRRHAVMTLHTTSLPVEKARGAALVAISDRVADEVRHSHPGLPVTTIYNAIDFDAVPRRGRRAPGRPVRLVQLGRVFADVKGQDLAIEAVARLVKAGTADVTVDFIGPGPDIDSLSALAARLGVGDRVRFLGELSRAETYSILPEYDLMVHPSRIEGFGLAIIEGMAAGVPVITTDSGAPAEVAAHGRLGRIFAYGDAEALAEAVRADIDDYDAALDRAARAYDEAARLYSLGTMADAYDLLYRKTCDKQ